jgi:rubrerythrin
MKRFGEKAVREAIAAGAIIRDWDWYTLNGGSARVIIDGEQAGYITSDLFAKLLHDGTIARSASEYSYRDYTAAAPAADEAAKEEAAARIILDAVEDSFRALEAAGVISNLKIEPLTKHTKAPEEKTAEEWNEESDRVREAVAATLPGIVTEEAPAEPAQKPQKLTPYERVIAKDPDNADAWRLPGYPGPVYSIAYTHHLGGWWKVHFPSFEEYRAGLEELTRGGYTIEETTKTENGHTEPIPAEAPQEPAHTPQNRRPHHYTNTRTKHETTSAREAMRWHRAGDSVSIYREATETQPAQLSLVTGAPQEKRDENREHVRSIALELDAWADGRAHRCPECGDNLLFPEDVGNRFRCPYCGETSDVEAWEPLGFWDYFQDALDVDWILDSNREYKAVRLMVACGGPNIYVNTWERCVELYWWTESARFDLLSSTRDAIDEWAAELWSCGC